RVAFGFVAAALLLLGIALGLVAAAFGLLFFLLVLLLAVAALKDDRAAVDDLVLAVARVAHGDLVFAGVVAEIALHLECELRARFDFRGAGVQKPDIDALDERLATLERYLALHRP